MGGFTIQIEGLRELAAKLAEMKTSQIKRVIHDGLGAGAKVFQAAVMEEAPERPDLPSGDALPPGAIKGDIEIKFGRSAEGLPAAIIAPGRFTRKQAGWVEYGHDLIVGGWSRVKLVKSWWSGEVSEKQIGPGKVIAHVPAHSFIRKAYEMVRDEAIQTAVDRMRRMVGLGAIPSPIYEGRGPEENYSGEDY